MLRVPFSFGFVEFLILVTGFGYIGLNIYTYGMVLYGYVNQDAAILIKIAVFFKLLLLISAVVIAMTVLVGLVRAIRAVIELRNLYNERV